MLPKDYDKARRRWRRWIQTISKDVQSLVIADNVFRRSMQAVVRGKRIKAENIFYQWTIQVFETYSALGWAVDIEDDVLRLFACIDATEAVPLGDEADEEKVSKEVVDRSFRRLESFGKHALSGKFADVEESQPVADLIQVITGAAQAQQEIELHVLATGTVTDRTAATIGNGELRREIWDLTRLARICGASAEQPAQPSSLGMREKPRSRDRSSEGSPLCYRP
jgi:hypothetical protein